VEAVMRHPVERGNGDQGVVERAARSGRGLLVRVAERGQGAVDGMQ
jgi:hypothetical protein